MTKPYSTTFDARFWAGGSKPGWFVRLAGTDNDNRADIAWFDSRDFANGETGAAHTAEAMAQRLNDALKPVSEPAKGGAPDPMFYPCHNEKTRAVAYNDATWRKRELNTRVGKPADNGPYVVRWQSSPAGYKIMGNVINDPPTSDA